jgi:hypothetical protein
VQNTVNFTGILDGKHKNRNIVLSAQRNRRCIHDLQIPLQNVEMRQRIVAFGIRIRFRIL